MTALWIVGILLAIFLVVQLSRVGVRLAFGEECRVMLRLGPIRMQVVPKKETAKKKPKKYKATKKKKEKSKEEMPKITARAVLDSLPELWRILKKGLRMTFHRVRVAPMDISAVSRGGRPGGHGAALRPAQCGHVYGDADAAGAGAYAGPAYPPGAGAAGRGDEDFGRSGRVLFNMGSDGHRLCLRRAAHSLAPTTSQTAA